MAGGYHSRLKGAQSLSILYVSYFLYLLYLFFFYAIQKLYDYRGKIAYKAIQSVFSYLYDGRENHDDTEIDGDEIAKLAKGLLVDQGFIFKGMENKHQVSYDRAEWTLI
jgi:hypothetical protein